MCHCSNGKIRKIRPIESLTLAQDVADDLVKSRIIVNHLEESSALAGNLSQGTTCQLLASLKEDEILTENLNDNIIVHRYLLSKYANIKTNVKLTCVQLVIAIKELKRVIELIKFQHNPELAQELAFIKHILKSTK